MEEIRLVAQYPDNPVFRDIFSEADFNNAESSGAKIHVIDEETGNPGEMLFDGERWVGKKPICKPSDFQEIALPRADYVEAVTNLFQVEMEAIVNEIEPEAAQVRTMAVSNRLSSLREIMQAGRQALEAQDIQVLNETTEKIKEVTSGTVRS